MGEQALTIPSDLGIATISPEAGVASIDVHIQNVKRSA
jgi:hypothetical protein